MSEGCYLCGVRADVGCKHRPAEGQPPIAVAEGEAAKAKKPISGGGRYRFVTKHDGQGRNFHRRKSDG